MTAGTSQSAAASLLAAALLSFAVSLPVAAEDAPAASEPDSQALELALEEIASLQRRLADLDERVPEAEGLTQRIAHRRIERIWIEIFELTHALAGNLAELEADAVDPAKYEGRLRTLLPQIDAAIRQSTQRVRAELAGLSPQESTLAPAELAEIYYRRGLLVERVVALLDAQAQNLALMKAHGLADRTESGRSWLVEQLGDGAYQISLALEVASDDARGLAVRLEQLPEDAEMISRVGVAQGRVDSLAEQLRQLVSLMLDEGIDATGYQQQILLATGEVSRDMLNPQVVGQLARRALAKGRSWLSDNGAALLLGAALLVLVMLGFWFLSRVAVRIVTRALDSSRIDVSQLLRSLAIKVTRNLVLLLGFLVALSQIGVSVGPLLAGVGVVGFVVGFALQDSLSNFASGVLILFYRPFDVGDVVEIGGVFGKVDGMSLVNTTLLTFDNQLMIIPNTQVWGGVIKNVTAQHKRRVDMTFGISYGDDIEAAERLLDEILAAHEKVLADPAPVVKLHELADSSVNFAVRPWVLREDYWDVYWDITRSVKLRFDEAGISIPFPQRDIHVHDGGGEGTGA